MDQKIEKINYTSILSNKNYMLYLIGQLISRLGDSIDSIAYAWMVYELSGSASLMALLFGVNALPNILLQPLGGVFISYKKKKDVLLICNVGRGVIVLLTVLLLANGQLQVWHLFLFTICNSIFESFQYPASTAALPLLLEEREYSYATGLRATLSQLAELVGLGLAGIFIGWIGIMGAMVIDALSFLICGILQYLPTYKNEVISEQSFNKEVFLRDFKEGFQFIVRSPIMKSIIFFGAFFSVLLLPLNTLSVAYVQEYLHMGVSGISIISASLTVGMIIGSFVFPKLRARYGARKTFLGGGILFGLAYCCVILWPMFDGIMQYVVATSSGLVLGCSASMVIGIINVSFLEQVPPDYLGRVAGVFNSLANVATPLGSMFVAMLCTLLPIIQIFFLFAIGILLLFLIQFKNRSLHEL